MSVLLGPDPATEAPRQASWAGLASAVRGCVACPELALSRIQVVPGSAPAGGVADLLLVGEAPGAAEDESGVPFVGKSGRLLDSLLAEVGLSRDRIAVANVLKCRPPRNRVPLRVEVERCRPWLVRQVELADPAVIVALGRTATKWLAGPGLIRVLRERSLTYAGKPLAVTYHPSAAIRFGPEGMPLASLREDLRKVADLVGGAGAR